MWARCLLSTVLRRSQHQPHSVVGCASYLDILTASDLAALFNRQGGRCPLTHARFFIPPEQNLPSLRHDLLTYVPQLSEKSKCNDNPSMEPAARTGKHKYSAALSHLPWPVRIDLSEEFIMGNLVLIKYFMVDPYHQVGGLAGLQEIMQKLPTMDSLRKLANTPIGGFDAKQ